MNMELYREIYEFASSAGALEGYVYAKEKLDTGRLENWIKNLVNQYHDLPGEVRQDFQTSLDRTVGRTVQSLIPVLGEDHDDIRVLKSMIVGEIPRSPHDFRTEKKEKAEKYGE
jgi:hypothetical protein